MKQVFLPSLKWIKIEHYSLFLQQPSFEFTFLDGISSIIGGNGIGKTTFVEIIMYCLVGHRSDYSVIGKKKKKENEKIYREYFRSRMKNVYPNNSSASATLCFEVNKNEIIIKRSLYDNLILSVRKNGVVQEKIEQQNYSELMTDLTKISSFEALEKIIRGFLFFDEQRTNIAWETDTQDEILRILFFEEEYYNLFKKYEEDATSYDTKGRHKSEDRRVEKESVESLEDERRKLYGSMGPIVDDDLSVILIKKNNMQTDRENLMEQLQSVVEEFHNLDEKCNEIYGEKTISEISIRNIDEKIGRAENKLYQTLYSSMPDFYLPLEKSLVNAGKCLACGTESKLIKQNAKKIRESHSCIVCSSLLQDSSDIEEKELIEEINDFQSKKNNLMIIYENQSMTFKEIEEKRDNESKLINNFKKKIDQINREILFLDAKISEYSLEKDPDTYVEILKKKQESIERLEKETLYFYKLRDEMKKKLENLNNKFKKIITDLNSHLSRYFNKYANTFIGLPCELVVKQKNINSIPHVIYVPKVDDIIRENISAVSESQRFFLDQAFRMAIIDYLQSNIKDFKTFFITETPEGSLDIAYEEKVAEMFNLFASSKNNIIFTSNLNSSKFLSKIYEKIELNERKTRTLNLLEKGYLSTVQDIPIFNAIQTSLFEEVE